MGKYDKWVMLLIGLVAGWLISTAWPALVSASSNAHWWDIAIAAGTVGAVVTAVSADWRQRKLAKRKAVMRAKLLAPRLSIRLISVTADLKTLMGRWSKSANPFDDPVAKEAAAEWADRSRELFQMEQLEIIVDGSEACAMHLSKGLTYLEIFSDMLRRVTDDQGRVQILREKAIKYIGYAQSELNLASKECAKWQHWK